MNPIVLSPAEACALASTGARVIDIRGTDEHAREHIPGAINVPLVDIAGLPRQAAPVVFHCRSGMRTADNAASLASACGDAPAYIIAGGIDAWRAAGLPTSVDRSQPLEIMRQVQIAAGSLVLLGVISGLLASPAFFGLSAFVGAGLMVAGATGWCGMANCLRIMPWNRPAQKA